MVRIPVFAVPTRDVVPSPPAEVPAVLPRLLERVSKKNLPCLHFNRCNNLGTAASVGVFDFGNKPNFSHISSSKNSELYSLPPLSRPNNRNECLFSLEVCTSRILIFILRKPMDCSPSNTNVPHSEKSTCVSSFKVDVICLPVNEPPTLVEPPGPPIAPPAKTRVAVETGACCSPTANIGSWLNLGSRSFAQCNCPAIICNICILSFIVRHGHSKSPFFSLVLLLSRLRCSSAMRAAFSSGDMCFAKTPAFFKRSNSNNARVSSSLKRNIYSDEVRLL